MNVKQYIGAQIRDRRKAAKISQEQLANHLGYTRTSIVNIETGRHGVPSDSLWMICNALRCTPNDLFPDTSPVEYKYETVEKVVFERVPKSVQVKKLVLQCPVELPTDAVSDTTGSQSSNEADNQSNQEI